jgi:hypothetical protein
MKACTGVLQTAPNSAHYVFGNKRVVQLWRRPDFRMTFQVDGRQDPAFLEGDATTRALMMTDEVGDKVGFPHE